MDKDLLTTIVGTYEKTLFRDEKSGFTIFSLHVKKDVENRSSYGNITCKGKIPIYTKSNRIYRFNG